MTYASIDDVINAWASRRGLKLNTDFGGEPRRFCYVSAGNDECFQISIEPPDGGWLRSTSGTSKLVTTLSFTGPGRPRDQCSTPHWRRPWSKSPSGPRELEAALLAGVRNPP